MTKKGKFREAIFFLGIAAIWIVPVILEPGGVAFQPGAMYSDLLISHWPNAYFLKTSLMEWGSIPWWNLNILSGAPFAADPLAGIWYLPTWLAVILPENFGFNLYLWLHLAWAGWGMYRLLHAEKLDRVAAVIGAVAFSGLPKLIGHLGLGHVSLVAAVSWTPWAVLTAGSMTSSVLRGQSILRWAALNGVVLGIIFIADPRWVPVLFLMHLAYSVHKLAHSQIAWDDEPIIPLKWLNLAYGYGVIGLFFAGIASILGLPLLQFLRLSTRANLGISDNQVLSLPLARLIQLLFPETGGWAEWMLFSGVIVLGLAILGVCFKRRSTYFWAGVGVVSIILSLGTFTPLYSWLLKIIPGLNLIRVPARFLFCTGFALAILAAYGTDSLIKFDKNISTSRALNLGLIAFGALGLFLLAGSLFAIGRNAIVGSPSFLYIGVGSNILAGMAFWLLRTDHSKQLAALILLAVVIGELAVFNASLLEVRPMSGAAAEQREILKLVQDLPESGRILSLNYNFPQHQAAEYGLEMADGVNPLQLAVYWNLMSSGLGFSSEEYSVTLPPFPDGDTSRAWKGSIDPEILSELSIRYLVSAVELDLPGFIFQGRTGKSWLYENPQSHSWAWIQSNELDPLATAPVRSITRTPNRILLTAEGPGTLVLSEVVYPAWHARVDGLKQELIAWGGVLRAVQLGDGEHQVEFVYRPSFELAGIVLHILSLTLFVFIWRRD
jgi:hypothetical protein